MCSIAVAIFLASMVQVHVKELVAKQTAEVQEKLVDQLVNRLFKASRFQRSFLDDTVILKQRNLMPECGICPQCDGCSIVTRSLADEGSEGEGEGLDQSFADMKMGADGGGGGAGKEDSTGWTKPEMAGNLKKGQLALLNGHPCKISEVSSSKSGKHGHAKCNFVGVDIFTHKKIEDCQPSGHNMDCPVVKTVWYTFLMADYDSGEVSLLKEDGTTKDDLNLPTFGTEGGAAPDEEAVKLVQDIKRAEQAGQGITVQVISAMGKEKIMSMKIEKDEDR